MKVSQVLCAAGPVDAVTNQGLSWRRRFDAWGWEGEDYAAYVAPGVPSGSLRSLRDYRNGADQILLLHYSGHVSRLEELMPSSARSLLVSHNVTPARFFWAHEPVDAARCELARDQLAELARRARDLAGVSEFNASELRELSGREAAVIPVLFERDTLAPPAGEPAGPPTVLFVGRLAPHKRQDLVIRAFARLRERIPEARLVLVGIPLNLEFERALRDLAAELAPGAVSFETSGIGAGRLAELYRSAHVFLCLSEHEGFGIPLLEAFHFRVPVIARAAGAVGEVVADAGVLLDSGDGIDVTAELLRIVLSDAELRDELRRRGERRLERYDARGTEALMREHLQALAA